MFLSKRFWIILNTLPKRVTFIYCQNVALHKLQNNNEIFISSSDKGSIAIVMDQEKYTASSLRRREDEKIDKPFPNQFQCFY